MAGENTEASLDDDQIAKLLGRVRARETPSDLVRQQVKQNVKAVWQDEVQSQKHSSYSRLYALAAVFVSAIAGLFVLQSAFYSPAPADAGTYAQITQLVKSVQYKTHDGWRLLDKTEISAQIRLRTLAHSYAAIQLDSGINLRLAPESEIELVRADLVKLDSGQVYIDSQQGTSIVITTPFGDATDIGTQFMVDVKPDQWQVQVRRGIVEISPAAHPSGTLSAKAGERVLFSANEVIRESVPADDTSWHWTQNVTRAFKLEAASVSDYLQWVERESGKEVSYASDIAENAAKRTILHGAITGLRPLESLAIVLPTTRFTWHLQQPGRILIDQAVD